MMDVRELIKLGLESLPMSELDEETYHNFLHDIKHMVIDLENVKSTEKTLEERMDILHIEYMSLKSLLEDVCDHNNRIKIPHRCPVCNGSTFDLEGGLCNPCDGRGIVWG